MVKSNCTNQSSLMFVMSWIHTPGRLPCVDNITNDVGNDSTFVDVQYVSTLSPLSDTFVGIYLIIIQIFAITCNCIVLSIAIRKRTFLKQSDMFVVLLAASDLGHPLIAFFMAIASSFSHKWIFGDSGCQWYGFTSFFFGINSMMILTTMSFNRFLYITRTQIARKNSRAIMCTLLAIIIASSLFWSISPLLGWGRYGPEPFKTSCTLVWDNPDRSYVTLCFVFVFGFPVMVMFYSYGRILCLTMATRYRRLNWVSRTQTSKLWNTKEIRLVKITSLMCFTYVIFWSPYAIVAMIKTYSHNTHIPTIASVVPCLVAKASHAFNPVIYSLLNKNFSRHIPSLFWFNNKSGNQDGQNTLSIHMNKFVNNSNEQSPTSETHSK